MKEEYRGVLIHNERSLFQVWEKPTKKQQMGVRHKQTKHVQARRQPGKDHRQPASKNVQTEYRLLMLFQTLT